MFVFVSTLPEGWGGSEYLWSRTALRLAEKGEAVAASVAFRSNEPAILGEMSKAGIQIIRRHAPPPVPPPAATAERVRRWVARRLVSTNQTEPSELETLQLLRPTLVIISQPTCVEGIEWMDACLQLSIPYVTIAQSCHEMLFHSDEYADSIEAALCGARCSYFVADDTRVRMENFLARSFPCAEVVRNPFNVAYDTNLSWPQNDSSLKLANVARLHIPSKGQEILLQILSQNKWRQRDVTLDFFGKGPNEGRLQQLANKFDLNNVRFCGHVDGIENIWADHHALVLPSKYEGLPIALVEAMLCGRPAVVTNVSGNSEVMQDGLTGFIAEAPTVAAFDSAMEQLWESRTQLKEMGQAAGRYIRTLVPSDPAGEFADRLLLLSQGSTGSEMEKSEKQAIYTSEAES